MDCNKTIDFFAELKRLCSLRRTCGAIAHDEQCPMHGFCEITYSKIYAEDAIKAVENLQKWSDEHSKKTYAQDFFEKFPKAPKDKLAKSEYPDACRNMIYGGGCPKIDPEIDSCYECWNEPMEE